MEQHTTNGATPVGQDGHRELRERVRNVVNAADPEGLLAMGAPDDEYDTQIDRFTGRLSRGVIAASDVLEVWALSFGPDTWLVDHPEAVDQLTRALNDARTA